MADSPTTPTCAHCGVPLAKHDVDRDTCPNCRSPKGKVADLDIAIRASGDDPERIRDWPAIRHSLRKRFCENHSYVELWERCTDWLRAEGGLEPNEYLPLPLTYLRWLLENGVIRPDEIPASKRLDALHAVRRELGNWNQSISSSETGYVGEDILTGHPLYAAIVALQPNYGGNLPKPALGYWRTFQRLARSDDEAAGNQAERLLEWVKGEIQTSSDPPAAEGNACTPGGQPGSDETSSGPKRRGRKKANGETVKQEAKLAADWVRARDAGTYKGEFAKEAGMTQKSFDTLLDRVAKRKSRSDN